MLQNIQKIRINVKKLTRIKTQSSSKTINSIKSIKVKGYRKRSLRI